jgi:hypothetical protein
MKNTNYHQWVKHRELAEKYHSAFISDCKRELDQYFSEEKEKKILSKLLIEKQTDKGVK